MPRQGLNAWLNGAGSGAIVDASPFGDIGRRATEYGKQWGQRKTFRAERRGNAARHALWQALLSARYGNKVAEAIANGHELGDECSIDSRVDQYNNRVAREIADKVGKDEKKIEEAITNALEQGLFITYDEDPRVPPPPPGCE